MDDEISTFHAVTKTLAVVDLVDSTDLAARLGNRGTARFYERHERLARDLVASHEGTEVEKADGFVLLFREPLAAVRFALAYHDALAALARELGEDLAARAAIHLGEIYQRRDPSQDVTRGARPLAAEGLAEPVAARLVALAGRRQTLLTRGAFETARAAAGEAGGLGENVRWLEHGSYQLQGIEEPIEVFEVGRAGFAPLGAPAGSDKVRPVGERPAWRPEEAPLVGWKLLERYELTAEIGRGGMGVVYRARDPRLGRDVAVKMIPPSMVHRDAVERFRREARVVAQMDHASIVPIHDFGDHEGSLFLVMPLVEGTTLRRLLRQGGLALGDVLDVAVQVADALDYSHERGVVHRDVKPENLMIARERGELRVRVMDFGLALGGAESRLTGTGGVLGTAHYMSPEQVRAAPVDGRSDLYAVGTVLYECLAGEPPFTGTLQALLYRIVHEYPLPLRSRGVEIDARLEEIVLGCLAKEPRERPASGKELARALRRHRESLDEGQRALSLAGLTEKLARPAPPHAPLVGRRAELAALQASLHAALDGECQLALVAGDSGTGKTLLLSELGKLAAARGVRVLQGRFADHQSALPYQGLCELVQDYFRAPKGISAVRHPDLSDLASDLVALFPVFSEIEQLQTAAMPAPGAGRPSPDLRRGEPTYVFELLARTLRRLASGRPLVLLLECLHSGQASLDALDYLVRRLGPTPTLFVGTYRPSEVGRGHPLHRLIDNFQDDPRFRRVVLGALDPGTFRELVEVMVGSDRLADSLVEALFQATAGNLFFGQELIRSLLENDAIHRDERGGVWVLRGKAGIPAEDLPVTIQQAVERRIYRLPEEHRRILQLASVLGQGFDYEDLSNLAGDEPRLEETVDALLEAGILEEDRTSKSDRLLFASGVVRDVIYHGLARRKRRALHRRHGRFLEKRYAGRPERVYPQLVHHFSEGDVADKTVTYGLALARRFLDSWSAEDAVRAAATALEFAEEEDEVQNAPLLRAELLFVLARAERLAGHVERALREAQRAAAAFEKAGAAARAAEVALFLAETSWHARQSEETWRWVERGRGIAPGPESADTLSRLLTLGATVANLRGDYPTARGLIEEAETLAPAAPLGPGEEPPVAGGTLVTALSARLTDLDPCKMSFDEEIEVASNVFEPLIETSVDGSLAPRLCEGWGFSAGGRRLVVELRRDVRFSDSRRLHAADAKRSLERAGRLGVDLVAEALSAVDGFAEFRAGRSAELSGIEVRGEHELVFHLTDPLPIFPALLAMPQLAIVRAVGDPPVLFGTGPFRATQSAAEIRRSRRVVLRRNAIYWRGVPPRLDKIEFRTAVDASGIAQGLRSGEIDLGRDLSPADLENVLRDPRFRSGLVEATRKNVYFVLFRPHGPGAGRRALRQALAGVVNNRDLVWRTLGRFAQPASSLVPPGLLGHDPGRRRRHLTIPQARALLPGGSGPLRLRAAIHPLFQDRYASLTAALFEAWSLLGVEVENVTPTPESFFEALRESSEIDLLLSRYNSDYDDPDNFTHALFHSKNGVYRHYYSSPEADAILQRARGERRASRRQALYQRFEKLLDEESLLLPLFHDVDYRIRGPRLRGLTLRSSAPYVNYATLGKLDDASSDSLDLSGAFPIPVPGGEIHVALRARVETLDPAAAQFAGPLEIVPNVFETLTRVEEGARIVPWLARSYEATDGGRAYRFHLREDVRFHDGRRLSARDVRYSFERAFRTPRAIDSFLPIVGARALREGAETALAGFRIVSATEFAIELERPLSFFPAFLTYPGFGIVAEGSEGFTSRFDDGCAGTGPFRVLSFEPGRRVELERNPGYWRLGTPKSERLVCHFGGSPERTLEEFREGRLSLVSELRPGDVEALLRDPELAAGYHESPRLATCFLALHVHRGPLRDPALRRAFARALDVEGALSDTVGRSALGAHGLIPPGLLGFVSPERAAPAAPREAELGGVELVAGLAPLYSAEHAAFWERLEKNLDEAGVRLDVVHRSDDEIYSALRDGELDFAALRYVADFPDTDGIVTPLLHSGTGLLAGTAEIDRLIEAGRGESDPALRDAIYREIEQVLAREALLIPLFFEQSYRFCQPRVAGLRFGLTAPVVRYEELSARG